MSLLTAFTTQLELFSKEICNLYPDDSDLNLGHSLIVVFKKTNPRKLLQIYNTYVSDFKDYIDNKDESFFLNHDFKDIATKNKNDELTFSLVIKLKEYWSELSDNNKETSWKFFQVLNKLTDKINQIDQKN